MEYTKRTLQVFTKEVDPIHGNFISIYEQRAIRKHFLFKIDRNNFESDKDFIDTVDYIVNSLNEKLI